MKLNIPVTLLILVQSCQNPDQIISQEQPISSSALDSALAPSLTMDEKFLGYWKYHSSSHKDDSSMHGIIGTLKKLSGTQESYTFHYIKFDMVFTKKDDYTLEGVDNLMSIKYMESTHHLRFMYKENSYDELVKLK